MHTSSRFIWLLCAIIAGASGCTSGSWMGKRLEPALHQAVRNALTPEYRLRQVADRVLLDNPKPPPFDWGEGVMMAGMLRAGEVLHEPKYIDFVRNWADHWRQFGLAKVLEGTGSSLKGYCGHWGPGMATIMLYERTKNPVYLDMTRQISNYIEQRATRTADGGLGHWHDNHELWVDTLYMACPPLVRLSRVDNKPALLGDAVHQLDVFAKRNQDAKSGLFYHMYSEPEDKNVGVLWARGNGWVAMSYVEVLKRLDRASPDYARLHAAFTRQLAGLLATQDPQSSLWHTVLDRPESYLETSASAMFVYAIADAHNSGLLSGKDQSAAAVAAWLALTGKVDRDGRVFGVSAGTGPADYDKYASRPVGTFTWGTGAFLLAASSLCGS